MKHSVKVSLSRPDLQCSPIRFRISWAGERVDAYCGLSIEPDKWDSVRCCVMPKAISRHGLSAGTINKRINQALASLDEFFDRSFLVKQRCPTREEVKAYFDDFAGRQREPMTKSDEFFSVMDKFIGQTSVRNEWSSGTIKKFKALKNHLRAFKPGIQLSDISEDLLQELVAWYTKKGYKNPTIFKNIGYMKWFIGWAVKNGIISTAAHEEFKPKLKGADGSVKTVIYLEWDELMNIYSMPISKKGPLSMLEESRDVFCFQCFTGLRYSDVAKLRRSDIQDGYMTVVTKKTNDRLKIEFNKYSRAILDKYKDVEFKNDLALPVVSNQKLNDHLKILAEHAGITTPTRVVYYIGSVRHEEVYPKFALITTHCGRRTFVVNALRMGIPSEVIMKWTGHSDFKAMKPYIAIVDKLKEEQMQKFDSFGDTSPESPEK